MSTQGAGRGPQGAITAISGRSYVMAHAIRYRDGFAGCANGATANAVRSKVLLTSNSERIVGTPKSSVRFLERSGGRTLGQAAILWLLEDDRIASVLPNIYDSAQLREFVEASDKPRLSGEELERVARLVSANFGLEPEEPKFKGTMELVTA
jgi:hypothetical protein